MKSPGDGGRSAKVKKVLYTNSIASIINESKPATRISWRPFRTSGTAKKSTTTDGKTNIWFSGRP